LVVQALGKKVLIIRTDTSLVAPSNIKLGWKSLPHQLRVKCFYSKGPSQEDEMEPKLRKQGEGEREGNISGTVFYFRPPPPHPPIRYFEKTEI
jgi:hypothetical protein